MHDDNPVTEVKDSWAGRKCEKCENVCVVKRHVDGTLVCLECGYDTRTNKIIYLED